MVVPLCVEYNQPFQAGDIRVRQTQGVHLLQDGFLARLEDGKTRHTLRHVDDFAIARQARHKLGGFARDLLDQQLLRARDMCAQLEPQLLLLLLRRRRWRRR